MYQFNLGVNDERVCRTGITVHAHFNDSVQMIGIIHLYGRDPHIPTSLTLFKRRNLLLAESGMGLFRIVNLRGAREIPPSAEDRITKQIMPAKKERSQG